MAIDTGTSLDSGASDITYTGDEGPQDPRAMTDIEKIILQHWMQQGGSYGDDIPEEFRQQIIQIYGLDRDRSASGGIARLGLQAGGPPGVHGRETGGGYSDRERAEQQTRGAPPGRDVVTPNIITEPHYGEETQERLDAKIKKIKDKPYEPRKLPFPSFLNIGIQAAQKPLE